MIRLLYYGRDEYGNETYKYSNVTYKDGFQYEPKKMTRYMRYPNGRWIELGPCGDILEFVIDKRFIGWLEKERSRISWLIKMKEISQK